VRPGRMTVMLGSVDDNKRSRKACVRWKGRQYGGRQGWADDSETVADKVVFLETWTMAGKVRGQRVARAVR
jgi:hypothetical protein